MSIHKFDHHIQSDIFSRLRLHKELRYRDLKDGGIESSQFMYHLNGIIRDQYVEKSGRGTYRLTAKGIELAQHFSTPKQGLNIAPPTYTLIFLRSKTKRWGVVKRKNQPHIGKYACISGKMHVGETLKEAAKRELKDFTSDTLTCTLQYRGYVSVSVSYQGFQTHITGPVWFGDQNDEVAFPDTRHGELRWMQWEDLPYEQFIPGWKEIVAMIEDRSSSYLDLHYQI